MIEFVECGVECVEWICFCMFFLVVICEYFCVLQFFGGQWIGMLLYFELKIVVLFEMFVVGGVELVVIGNYGLMQDDIVVFLCEQGIMVFGIWDDIFDQYYVNVVVVFDVSLSILFDNGVDFVVGVVVCGIIGEIVGGIEEIILGGDCLCVEFVGQVLFLVIVINDSLLKVIGENKYVVGQLVVESFMCIINLMVLGCCFVVVGYGWCGCGVVYYLRVLGVKVVVVEIDELKVFEVVFDGFCVVELFDLVEWGEVFIIVIGYFDIFIVLFFEVVVDGVVFVNCGYFFWEIDVVVFYVMLIGLCLLVGVDGVIECIDFVDGWYVVLFVEGWMMNLVG